MAAQQLSGSEVQALLKAAIEHYRSGQLAQAESLYRQVLRERPDCADAFNNLGIVLQRQGRLREALQAYHQALTLNPDLAEAHVNLGSVHQQQGQLAEAVAACDEAIRLRPDYAEAYRKLGQLFQQQGNLEKAVQVYQQLLGLQPGDAEAYKSLGTIYYQQQQLEAALQTYDQALQHTPEDPEIYFNRGVALKAMGRTGAAIQAYVRALRFRPDYFEAHNNLGSLLQETERFDLAIQAFQQAINCKPDYARGYVNLAAAFKSLNRLPEAVSAYEQALALQPDLPQAQLGLCMSQLPIIYESAEDICRHREQYRAHLERLVHDYQRATVTERQQAAAAVGLIQPFYLTYQGQNDRELQHLYGQLVTQLMSSQFPQWSQPVQPRRLVAGDKVRVGIVSGFFYNHSNWKIPIQGWVQTLNRDRFELFGYYTRERQDAETEIAAQSFDHFLQGPLSVESWAAAIRQDQLDVLIFPEFGMDAMTIRLGGLRLAPVQATSWGHPETSGLPTIDYYLSSALMEPENGQDGYTESLVRLPNLSIYYTPLTLTPEPVTRSELGLAEGDVLYWCCQSLYKYLPQHDDVFPCIAAALPNSRFVFIAHASEQVTATFCRRLDKAFQAVGLNYRDYCRFLPKMSVTRFAGVAAIADVFLDSIGWSGCNSSLEVIAHNLPIVTWPGELMRGRHTLAMLKLMGLDALVAASKADYVVKALRLGSDPQYRQDISRQIAAHKHQLYGDLAPIRALEDFLWQVAH